MESGIFLRLQLPTKKTGALFERDQDRSVLIRFVVHWLDSCRTQLAVAVRRVATKTSLARRSQVRAASRSEA
jgi:hypothetical protein